MENNICLNCGHSFASEEKFCPHCGQRRDIKRFTFRQLLHDFLQTFLNTERGIIRLLKGLAIKPGQTAAAYVDGKRKTYYNAFTFLAICTTIMVFINGWMKPYGDLPVADPRVLNNMPDELTKELYLVSIQRIAGAQNFVNNNLSLISVMVTPYFAFGLWLVFRKRNRNAAEITVAYILYTAFSNLLSTIFIYPWLAAYRNTAAYYPIFYTSIFLQTMYIAWGLKTFFKFPPKKGYIKVLAALCLIGLIGFILLMLAFILYVYRGETARVLKHL